MSRPRQRVLRVFFDFGHEWPLWESGLDGPAKQPTDYGFSPELTDLLRRWYAAWAPIAGYDIAQSDLAPSEEDRRLERELARQAVAVIRREVPPDVDVEAR